MQEKQEIYDSVVSILVDEFDIDACDISMSASLYEDLDLDSIDAVDLVAKLQDLTGKKVHPEQFKAVRTVDDLVRAVELLVKG